MGYYYYDATDSLWTIYVRPYHMLTASSLRSNDLLSEGTNINVGIHSTDKFTSLGNLFIIRANLSRLGWSLDSLFTAPGLYLSVLFITISTSSRVRFSLVLGFFGLFTNYSACITNTNTYILWSFVIDSKCKKYIMHINILVPQDSNRYLL